MMPGLYLALFECCWKTQKTKTDHFGSTDFNSSSYFNFKNKQTPFQIVCILYFWKHKI